MLTRRLTNATGSLKCRQPVRLQVSNVVFIRQRHFFVSRLGINPFLFEIGSGFQVLNFQAKVIPVDVSTFLPQKPFKMSSVKYPGETPGRGD